MDDIVYDTHLDIRQKVARGNCFLELCNGRESEISCVVSNFSNREESIFHPVKLILIGDINGKTLGKLVFIYYEMYERQERQCSMVDFKIMAETGHRKQRPRTYERLFRGDYFEAQNGFSWVRALCY